jgi:hypothetical protein
MLDKLSSQASSQNTPSGSVGVNDGFWTFASVEERLIDAMRLWWRTPGGGRWPFASDAPWELMTRKTRIEEGGFKGREHQLRMQAEDAEEAKRWEGVERKGPLTRDEVALRDETTEWLRWCSPQDRKVVVLVLKQRAAGMKRIDWPRVKREIGSAAVDGIGNKGVYRRYSRSVSGIARRLNGPEAIAQNTPRYPHE